MKTIKVLKQDDGWIVSKKKNIYNTQEEAINIAKNLAKKNEALLVVHKANGEVYAKETRIYAKNIQPHIYGKRSLNDKDIIASIVSAIEARNLKNSEVNSRTTLR